MKKFMHRPISLLLAVLIVMSVFTILPVTSAGAATVTDVLTANDFAATSTTYTSFSVVKKTSDAVYAGQSAKDSSGNIQLRAKNSNSGIVTTTSGGKVKSVKISVGSGSNTVDVYCSNTAYTSASDLYDSSKQGTKVGSTSTTATITVTDDYSFVGIRSNSGAIYLSSVEITWEKDGEDTPTHTVTWNYKDSSGIDTSDTTTVKEGATPTHADPESYDLNGMRYTFTGWDPALAEVTADTAYTAQYSSAPITYTVRWLNDNSAVLETDTDVVHDATPEYNGATPTKAADAQYTYTFSGWDPEPSAVQSDIDYTAQYTETLRSYTVTWINEGNTYPEELSYGATPAFDTARGGELTKAETEDYTYPFSGWSDGSAHYESTATLPSVTGDVTYTAIYTPKSKHETTDVLTYGLIGVTGTAYSNWSDKSYTNGSGAVYKGNSAGDHTSIQLRSNSSNSGIVTTTSGGHATKITVKWNSNTADGRTLNIYGKNTAYSAATDLYNDATAGTLLGTISKGKTEFVIENIGTYEYIGLRSASGAMYLDEIDITWGTGTKPTHTVTWLDEKGDEIYHEDVQEGKTPAFDTENHTLPTKAEDDENTYRFYGWTVQGGDGTVYTESNMPQVGDSVITFEPYFIPRSKFTENDNLYASYFTATGNSYKKFSNVASDGENEIRSEAVYAGHTAKHDSGAIQMNATSPNGIVTTASGGRASKVAVVWNSATTSGRTLQIYGKDSAYDPDNWYDSLGSLLGTIEKGTSDELEITSPYEYIAIRSGNSAVYLDKIEITWDTAAPTSHTVTWMNGESILDQDEVAYNTSPVYSGETPSKPDDDYHYTFYGWTNGTKTYAADAVLPQMKKDTTYTAAFDSTPIYHIVWKNGDTTLETDQFYGTDGSVKVSYDSATPTKAATNVYSYTFLGWKDAAGNRYYDVNDIPEVTSDAEFTALYSATPNYKSGRIVSTSDDSITYNVGGKYYMIDGEKKTFSANATFSEGENSFTLGDMTYTYTLPTEGVFAHTVYVTGEGTQDDPFEFYPNFIYSAETAKVADAHDTDSSTIHPGDGFKGNSKIRMRDAYVRFLQYEDQPDLECAHGTNGFMGISANRYGNRYQNENAEPYEFVKGDKTLYYLGELDNAHNFSEELILDKELGAVNPIFTVTWANWDGSVIRTNQVYQGFSPAYGTIEGSEPTRPDDDDYRYTFSGWTDDTYNYGKDDELPVVSGNITYTATYSSRELASYTITWNNWDGSQLAVTECKEDKVPQYTQTLPTRPTDEYMHVFAGWQDSSGNMYPKNTDLPKATADAEYTAYYTDTAIPGTYTVTWKDWNGTPLETDYLVDEGSAPSFDGDEPTRAEDADYTYTFVGWTPHLKTVTYNVTFTAQYAKTPKVAPEPIADIENIFPTDDGMGYDLKGMFYSYNGSEPIRFNWDELSVFSVEGDHLVLGGETVADIGIELKKDRFIAEFANTVFVTGTGSYSQPYVFHPNYTYSSDYKDINDGCPVAMNEESMNSQNIANIAYPGDSFKGTSSAKMTPSNAVTHDVRFITKNGNEQLAASYYVGVGTTTYGTVYSADTADHTFSEGCDTLWYHGEDDHNAYVFAETPPVKQTSFGDPETYTVTWVNDNDAELGKKTYFYGETPSYDGTPTSALNPASAFSGWTPEVSEVTENITYTATYSSAKFFAGHSLTLKGDIGIYFYIDVTAAGITPDDIKNGDASVTFSFSWKTSPAPYSDLSKSNIVLSKDNYNDLFDEEKGLFKIKCNTAAAEMTCVVHADAVVTGSVSYTDTDDYSVYEYGMTIVNDPAKYGDDLVTLAKAMLDYGAKAQTVFGIKTDDLANKELNGYSTQTVTADMIDEAVAAANNDKTASNMKENTDSFGLEYYGSSMVFLSETTLRHYYTIKDQSTYDSFKNDTTFNLDERKLPFVIFERADISAKDLDTLQVFTIGGQTYYYSVLDFSKSTLNSSKTTAANKALAMATYWYNQAANNYFDNL